MKVPVSSIAPGKTVLYRGEPCIVLEHREDGTLLMAVEHIEHTFGSSNNFAASSLRAHLNGAYLDALTESHPDEIITRTVDLTALNGSKEYGTVECKVAPLTLDELRKYHGIIPKPEVWEWSAPTPVPAPPAPAGVPSARQSQRTPPGCSSGQGGPPGRTGQTGS